VLNAFQREMYVHLIDWKWAQNITREPGYDRGIPYDAILPNEIADRLPMLYPGIVGNLKKHHQKYPFRIHKYFNHMASSQAANINLFLPILGHSKASAVLRAVKPDFARLAIDQLDKGYRIEFWDESYENLGDKKKVSGTDVDIAIAYYNPQDELCLWLIEHKLTEPDFTECGGYRSKGRQAQHDCSKTFAEILADKNLCYYHDVCRYHYWTITEANQDFFPNHAHFARCPFKGGLNQLWRNQLLALSIEQDPRQSYKNTFFSVVIHHGNTALDKSLQAYQDLIGHNPNFSVFTSTDVIAAAEAIKEPDLHHWITWYKSLYKL
jgi:hypothetical protein